MQPRRQGRLEFERDAVSERRSVYFGSGPVIRKRSHNNKTENQRTVVDDQDQEQVSPCWPVARLVVNAGVQCLSICILPP